MSNVPDFALSEASKSVIKDILTSKTRENDGILNLDELGECLESFGFDADDDDVDFLQKHLDDNKDGELEVQELMDNIDVINWHCFFGKELMREFGKIDTDGDGVIRYPEMLRVLLTRGEHPLQPQEGRKLLDMLARKYDANFDGKFSYAEFVKIWMSDLLPFKDSLGQEEEEEEKKPAKSEKPKKKLVKKKSSNLNGAGAPPEPRHLKPAALGGGSRYSPANLYGPKPGQGAARPTTSGTRTGARGKSAKVKSTTPKT